MSFGTSVPNVGGARRDWSNVIVDGVVANEVGASSLMAQQINLDAIAEVRVLLNSYRAEYGRAGGGQVQIVSKSGTSNYHGNLYYYGRNEALNATDFFVNRAGAKKPRYRFNTYGANLGGPVPKGDKKLFFFYSLEAPLVSRPGPAPQLDDADGGGDAGRLLADARQSGTADQHQGPAARGCVQRRDGRSRVLPRQYHSSEPHQLERPRAPEHASAGQQFRSDVHAGPVQLLDAGERRQPQDEQRGPGRLETDVERQPVLHVQGLVLRPARQRDHGRPEQVGLLQHALPEHGPGRAARTTRRSSGRTSCSTPTSAHASRPSSSTR